MNEAPTTSDAQVLHDAAVASVEPHALDAKVIYGVVVPGDAEHRVVDLERFLGFPRRTRGKASFRTAESFSAYINRHKTEATQVYALWDGGRAVAVINDDLPEFAGWRDHRAVLEFQATTEWRHWTGASGHLVAQEEFAEHVENGLDQILKPPAAEMLELAQRFEAATKVSFRSANILANGQRQLLYDEQVEARAGETGQIVIPREFRLALAPYEGSEPYEVMARLRYRIREGRLSIGYVLDRPERVQREAFEDVLSKVEQATEIKPLIGIAPEPTA